MELSAARAAMHGQAVRAAPRGWGPDRSCAAASGAPFFKHTKLPLGLQLYTLGGDLRADLDGELAKVAAAGYRTVEMAGYLGRSPAELRAAFDKAGLACPSAHVQAKSSATDPGFDNLDKLIADAHVIGWSHIVLPSFPTPAHIAAKTPQESYPDYAKRLISQFTADDWKSIADLLNAKGKALKAAGFSMGYHNHNFEMAPVFGRGRRHGPRPPAQIYGPGVGAFRDGRGLGRGRRRRSLRAPEGPPRPLHPDACEGRTGHHQDQLRLPAGPHRGGLRHHPLAAPAARRLCHPGVRRLEQDSALRA